MEAVALYDLQAQVKVKWIAANGKCLNGKMMSGGSAGT